MSTDPTQPSTSSGHSAHLSTHSKPTRARGRSRILTLSAVKKASALTKSEGKRTLSLRSSRKRIQNAGLGKKQDLLRPDPSLVSTSTYLVNPSTSTQPSTSSVDPRPSSSRSSEPPREYRVRVTDKNSLAFASPTLSQSSASGSRSTYIRRRINTFQEYVELQNEIERKRSIKLKNLFKPKPPPKFKEYLLYKCNYLIAGNESMVKEILSEHRYTDHLEGCTDCASDETIVEKLRKQQAARNELILAHKIERDKLMLAAELDVIRCRNKYQYALKNIKEQYSACTYLKEQQIYERRKSVEERSSPIKTINQDTVTLSEANIITTNEKEDEAVVRDYRYPQITNPRNKFNRRMGKVELDETKARWECAKNELISKHQQEAISLHAYQCTVFENIKHDFEIPKVAINLNSYDYPYHLWLPL